MFEEFLRSATEAWQTFSGDPTAQTNAALGGILLGVWTLVLRRRGRIRVDAPAGEELSLKVGKGASKDDGKEQSKK